MLDFTYLLTCAGMIVLKLLEKHVVLIDGFRFGNLNPVFPVKLVVYLEVKLPVKLDDFYDPLHKGVHTTDASPSLSPGGF